MRPQRLLEKNRPVTDYRTMGITMGSVTLWMQMSLDGFAEGPDHEPNWPVVDEELCSESLDQLRSADLFLYGRKTFELMAAFWPTADIDPAISEFYVSFARCWKSKQKIVFSRTLRTPGWNTRVVREGLVDEIARLKSRSDAEMVLFGGPETAAMFMRYDLIDEYRLFVHPMVFGGGTPLFPAHTEHPGLRLIDVKAFQSAVVQVHYHRVAAAPNVQAVPSRPSVHPRRSLAVPADVRQGSQPYRFRHPACSGQSWRPR